MFISSVSNGPSFAIRLNQRVFSFYGITIPAFCVALLIPGVFIVYGVFEFITGICLWNIKELIKSIYDQLECMHLEITPYVFFVMIVRMVIVWFLTAVQMEALGWYSMSTGSMRISIIQVDGLAHSSHSDNEVDLITQITLLIQVGGT